jgi:hypothetical protein
MLITVSFLEKKSETTGRRRRGWDTEESDSVRKKSDAGDEKKEEKSSEDEPKRKASDAKEDEKSSKTSTGKSITLFWKRSNIPDAVIRKKENILE